MTTTRSSLSSTRRIGALVLTVGASLMFLQACSDKSSNEGGKSSTEQVQQANDADHTEESLDEALLELTYEKSYVAATKKVLNDAKSGVGDKYANDSTLKEDQKKYVKALLESQQATDSPIESIKESLNNVLKKYLDEAKLSEEDYAKKMNAFIDEKADSSVPGNPEYTEIMFKSLHQAKKDLSAPASKENKEIIEKKYEEYKQEFLEETKKAGHDYTSLVEKVEKEK